jgi:hypothetical protein
MDDERNARTGVAAVAAIGLDHVASVVAARGSHRPFGNQIVGRGRHADDYRFRRRERR